MTEQEVIEQLSNYRRLQARMQVLSNYSVGAGITISRMNEDDHLQELHNKLRGLPSYMYLSKREQQLETVAHTYLNNYPTGVKSQQRAIQSTVGLDDEDERLLTELKSKIAKVIAARGYGIRDDIDAVIAHISELQDIQLDIKRIDDVLSAVERLQPRYAELLRLRYIDKLPIAKVSELLGVSERTFRRWNDRAISDYSMLAVK